MIFQIMVVDEFIPSYQGGYICKTVRLLSSLILHGNSTANNF